MPTASQMALFTNKKIMGFEDFEDRFLRYLQNEIREATKRLFVQGSFYETMPLASIAINQVQANLKVVLGDGYGHDGSGHILDLGQIDRTAFFENVTGTTYEVGAGYVEYPYEIRVNPRTGRPEYDRLVEGVGVEATPNSVTNNGTNLTIRVDSLFEQGVTIPTHAGRLVRVFKKIPADGALLAIEAIETAIVAFSGAQNQITTVGLLGQTTVSTDPNDYVVQLIGLIVLKNTATNRPTLNPLTNLFLGTVDGNTGAIPVTFDTSLQQIVQAQGATNINIAALANWADGTTNPPTNLQLMLEKLVNDLTSTTGGYGAAKLTALPVSGVPTSLSGTLADQVETLLEAVNNEQLNRLLDAITSIDHTSDTGAGDIPLALACYSSNDKAAPSSSTEMILMAAVGSSEFKWSGTTNGYTWSDIATTDVLKAVMCTMSGTSLNLVLLAVGDAGRWNFRHTNQALGTGANFSGTLSGTPNLRQVVEDTFNAGTLRGWVVGDRVYRFTFTTTTAAPTFTLVDSNPHVGAVPMPGRVVFYRPSDDRLYYIESPWTTLVQGAVVGMGIGSQPSSMIYDPDVGVVMTEDGSDTVYVSADGTSVTAHALFASSQDSAMAFRFQGRTFIIAQRDVNVTGGGGVSHGGRMIYYTKKGVFSTVAADWRMIAWPGPNHKAMPIGPGGASEVGQNWNFAACGSFVMGRAPGSAGTHGTGMVAIGHRALQVAP